MSQKGNGTTNLSETINLRWRDYNFMLPLYVHNFILSPMVFKRAPRLKA